MEHVTIIGCGIIGATIAYELSQVPNLAITVLDRAALVNQESSATGATAAALGVLMGAISQKVKGTAWELRQTSLQRYETLIPELEALTGRTIPFNRQGIVMLCFAGEDWDRWARLIEIRQQQGWHLERWNEEDLRDRCPQICHDRVVGAIYSPQDRQVNPLALTLALVEAAQQRGVAFRFGVTVDALKADSLPSGNHGGWRLQTNYADIYTDWVIIAAGLGSAALTQLAESPVPLQPVVGQGMQVRLPEPLGDRHFQPVITGEDIHIVPCHAPGNGAADQAEYWIGATVEFPNTQQVVSPSAEMLEQVWQGAIALCPSLAEAQILRRWWGVRPRPQNQPAPIIKPLMGHDHVLLATGHYRNGILLAPATAQQIRAMLVT